MTLSPRPEEFLHYLVGLNPSLDGPVSARWAAEDFGVSDDCIRQYVHKLTCAGAIRCEGTKVYQVLKRPEEFA